MSGQAYIEYSNDYSCCYVKQSLDIVPFIIIPFFISFIKMDYVVFRLIFDIRNFAQSFQRNDLFKFPSIHISLSNKLVSLMTLITNTRKCSTRF